MEGLQVLEQAIKKECKIGLGRSPMQEYSHFFRIKREDMDKASIETKKDWLLTMKAERRLYEDTSYREDEFHTNETLSKWIALEFRKKGYEDI